MVVIFVVFEFFKLEFVVILVSLEVKKRKRMFKVVEIVEEFKKFVCKKIKNWLCLFFCFFFVCYILGLVWVGLFLILMIFLVFFLCCFFVLIGVVFFFYVLGVKVVGFWIMWVWYFFLFLIVFCCNSWSRWLCVFVLFVWVWIGEYWWVSFCFVLLFRWEWRKGKRCRNGFCMEFCWMYVVVLGFGLVSVLLFCM